MSWRGGIFWGIVVPLLATSTAAITQVAPPNGAAAPPAQQSSTAAGESLVKANDCSACHAVSQKVVGPSYEEVAKRYRGQADARDKLVAKIKQGGSGNWGTVAMTPHATLSDADLTTMVEWILSLGEQPAAQAPAQAEAPAKLYTYTLADGTSVKLDFPLFVEGQQQKVTKAVFRGYETFDSYCYRCHGEDATGSEIAPDLRQSLKGGMTEQQFFSVVMAGRVDKGMPSWAGFLSQDDAMAVYEYVKGRSLDLVPVGRPPSESD